MAGAGAEDTRARDRIGGRACACAPRSPAGGAEGGETEGRNGNKKSMAVMKMVMIMIIRR